MTREELIKLYLETPSEPYNKIINIKEENNEEQLVTSADEDDLIPSDDEYIDNQEDMHRSKDILNTYPELRAMGYTESDNPDMLEDIGISEREREQEMLFLL